MKSINKFAIVITSIAAPNKVIKGIAAKVLSDPAKKFYVIGDTKSPIDFQQEGCEFYSIQQQETLGFSIAEYLPKKHYARKNIGYLQAWKDGFDCIVETDDDNIPYDTFWQDRSSAMKGLSLEKNGWVNVYKWFSDANVWPRGLPLEKLSDANQFSVSSTQTEWAAPIQQGLANENPDVDAVYRMIEKLPLDFIEKQALVLRPGQWCPFNSQNTTWFKEAFPLLYLPSYCSFRMTDIWRSFIAQRIAWTCGWNIVFHSATVYQERNEHSLLRDFEDEIPGYLNNHKIILALNLLQLKSGVENIYENLHACYAMMVEKQFITDEKELELVKAWVTDCKNLLG